MKTLAVTTVFLATIFAQQRPDPPNQQMDQATAETYEHLATAIIEIRATEDNLVKGILMHHHARASHHLEAALTGADTQHHLEAAADEIASIANEGDKAVQAIRQRLLKAGHHHHTDSVTKEDYIFIDSKEKASLLALAGKVGKMAKTAAPDAIRGASMELGKLFADAIAPE